MDLGQFPIEKEREFTVRYIFINNNYKKNYINYKECLIDECFDEEKYTVVNSF